MRLMPLQMSHGKHGTTDTLPWYRLPQASDEMTSCSPQPQARNLPDKCCSSVHSPRSARNTNWWMVQPAIALSSGPKLSAARCLAASAAAVPPVGASGGSPVVEASGAASECRASWADGRLEGGREASGRDSAASRVEGAGGLEWHCRI